MPSGGKLRPLLRQAKADGWDAWVKTEADEQAVLEGYCWRAEEAQAVLDFFPGCLCHSIGEWAGRPFELLPWQRDDVLSPIFGWVRRDNPQLRRFHTAYIEVAKKNGKSTLAAGVGNFLFRGDGEPGAHVFSAATKKEQAALVHDEAVRMIRKSPRLCDGVRINETTKTVSHIATSSKYSVIARDARGEEGKNIHGLIADEMHVWTDRAFWESLRYGGAARRNWLFFLITTAGIYDPATIAWELHQYAEDQIKGAVVDTRSFAYICAADKSVIDTDSLLDPAQHKKANPSYNDVIDPAEILEAAHSAKRKPSERLSFCRYRLNVWTHQAEGFIELAQWKNCEVIQDEEDLYGREAYGGLDLSTKRDLTAWVLLVVPNDEDPRWHLLVRAFAPKGTAEMREAKAGTPYMTWGQEGHLILTPGDTISYDTILEAMTEDRNRFEIKGIGADPWMLEPFRQQLEKHGIDVTPVEQTLKWMSEPTKRFEELYIAGNLTHAANPVLEWCARNVVPYEDGKGNIMPHKGKSQGASKKRIDLITAAVLAVAMALLDQPESELSVYWV